MLALLGDNASSVLAEAEVVEVNEELLGDSNDDIATAMVAELDEGVSEWQAHSSVLNRLKPNGTMLGQRQEWQHVRMHGGVPVLAITRTVTTQ